MTASPATSCGPMRSQRRWADLMRLDLPVADVSERVQRECDQARRDYTEQRVAIRLVRQLRQRAVQVDRLARLVVDRGLEQEEADQPKNDHPSAMTNDRKPLVHPFGRRAHLAGLRVLEEVLREPS